MPRIYVPTANPPRWPTRQHRHGSCSCLLGIMGMGMSPLLISVYVRKSGHSHDIRTVSSDQGTRAMVPSLHPREAFDM